MDFFANKKTDGKWYVIRTVSGAEQSVKNSLLQRKESFGLQDYILDIFIPTHDVTMTNAAGVKSTRQKNVYPGYILVKMIVTNESWYIVRNTPNVTGFLGAGSTPVPVSPEEFGRVQNVVEKQKEAFKTRIKEGDLVTILTGTFEGSEGKVTEVDESKGTVKLNVNLLGRDTSVEADFADVKAK